MSKKIVFLSVNPWESFLPPTLQGESRFYYEAICEKTLLQEANIYCGKQLNIYGEIESLNPSLFQDSDKCPQIIYLQSHQREVMNQVMTTADLCIVGMPCCKKECDKIFLKVLPWKEKILFLWDWKLCGKKFLNQAKREYGLTEEQIINAKELPLYLTEALKS